MKRMMILVTLVFLLLVSPLAVGASGVEAEEDVAGVPDEVIADTEAPEETVGARLLALVEAYAGELLATVTLAVSLFNTYRYQKGLVPMLYQGLKGVASAAQDATGIAKESAGKTEEEIKAFLEEVRPLMARMTALCEGAEAISKEAETLKERIEEGEIDRELTKRWMKGVADMLYRVFSSANLPQYAKDAIGKEYSAITACCEEVGHEDQLQKTST
jgi:hypothetical protein